jgi:hypothetical protein
VSKRRVVSAVRLVLCGLVECEQPRRKTWIFRGESIVICNEWLSPSRFRIVADLTSALLADRIRETNPRQPERLTPLIAGERNRRLSCNASIPFWLSTLMVVFHMEPLNGNSHLKRSRPPCHFPEIIRMAGATINYGVSMVTLLHAYLAWQHMFA